MKASFKFWVATRGYCLSCNATRLERSQLYYKNLQNNLLYSGSDLINIPSHSGGCQILLVETTKVLLHRI